jgi:hypothetical protein
VKIPNRIFSLLGLHNVHDSYLPAPRNTSIGRLFLAARLSLKKWPSGRLPSIHGKFTESMGRQPIAVPVLRELLTIHATFSA